MPQRVGPFDRSDSPYCHVLAFAVCLLLALPRLGRRAEEETLPFRPPPRADDAAAWSKRVDVQALIEQQAGSRRRSSFCGRCSRTEPVDANVLFLYGLASLDGIAAAQSSQRKSGTCCLNECHQPPSSTMLVEAVLSRRSVPEQVAANVRVLPRVPMRARDRLELQPGRGARAVNTRLIGRPLPIERAPSISTSCGQPLPFERDGGMS